MFRSSLFLAAAIGAAQPALATVFAHYVSGSYVQGTLSTYDQQFNNPLVVGPALDGPGAATVAGNSPGLTGLPGYTSFPYPGIESSFNSPYDTDQIVALGGGGQITVQFSQPISTSAGPAIGVFTNSGLIDTTGTGVAGIPAGTFSSGEAIVSVSQDGVSYTSLGLQNLNIPENYYLNAVTPYDTTAPADPLVANFGQPFTGTLNSFDGESYSQIVATLDGSAGGTWLDLSGSGLSQIQYVQFTEPADGFLALEAVSASDASVPEPVGAAGICIFAGLILRRKRVA